MLKLTGNLEQEVMSILWNSQTALKPAEVQAHLGETLAYTTIMTVMQRLYRKGILKRDKDGNAYRYTPSVTKDEYATGALDKVYKGILAAYGSLAISHFIESVKNDPEHREQLEKYLRDNE